MYHKVPKSTTKYQKIPKSTKIYQKLLNVTNNYQDKPKCTKKYQKVAKRTKRVPKSTTKYDKLPNIPKDIKLISGEKETEEVSKLSKSNSLVVLLRFLEKVFVTTLLWISEILDDFCNFTQLFVNLVQFLCIPLHNHMYGLIYKENLVQLVASFLS